jgi:hypothetical protein
LTAPPNNPKLVQDADVAPLVDRYQCCRLPNDNGSNGAGVELGVGVFVGVPVFVGVGVGVLVVVGVGVVVGVTLGV